MANSQEFKEWLRFPETIEALHAMEDQVKAASLNVRKVDPYHFRYEVGRLEGFESAIQFIEELGEDAT